MELAVEHWMSVPPKTVVLCKFGGPKDSDKLTRLECNWPNGLLAYSAEV